ncbi:MAG TPA: cupin domain-containing protein [Acidimicrobiia bacterium]|nr:cupin domain-containing protein [Acidimicrobiia bacterium]
MRNTQETARGTDSFDLTTTYVQLEDGPEALAIEVDDEFWDTIDRRPELHGGRLVGTFHNAQDWDIWEMHPAGDEIVCLLSGAIDVVLEEDQGERLVVLEAGQTCIVPRGVWHRAVVHEPGDTLHITRGAGTQHRPR